MSLFVDIEKRLGNFNLKVSFETEKEVLALLGASGCGKSMTLKCIAGIEKPDKGRIVLNDKIFFDSEKRINLKPQKRRVGYLFQQYALFPNMTVWQNIECGLREKENADDIISDMISKMKLEGKEKNKPAALSGGQQQRVALARILVNKPEVLLLDEPFSALDAHLRFQTEREVADIIEEYGKTTLLVSHDRDEVYRLSERIAVMNEGQIEKIGSRDEIFNDPETVVGARLTGCKNISSVEVLSDSRVYSREWGIELNTYPITEKIPEKKCTSIGIRMNYIRLNLEGDVDDDNTFFCHITDIAENLFSYTVSLKPETLKADGVLLVEFNKRIMARLCESIGTEIDMLQGKRVSITIPLKSVLLLRE